jgi:hypothetical protein
MTVIRRNAVTWVAYKDGLAHARRGLAPRTLCGAVPTPDRYAWPIREMCGVCRALEAGLKAERRTGAA